MVAGASDILGMPSPYRVADLRYRLLRGPVALEPLRILRYRDLMLGRWRVRVHILGASHAIRLSRGAEIITELLACVPDRSEGAARPFELLPPMAGEVGSALPVWAPAGEVRLERFDLKAVGDGLLGAFGEGDQLTAEFPVPAVAAVTDGAARTRIGWRVVGGSLEIETVHSYPEESAGVRSRTVFVLGEHPGRERSIVGALRARPSGPEDPAFSVGQAR